MGLDCKINAIIVVWEMMVLCLCNVIEFEARIAGTQAGKSLILTGVAESKKEHGREMLDKMEAGMDEFERIILGTSKDKIAPKQKELLLYVGG
ncbi:hypothetical protein C5167_014075 [Papaver somniferum]|uniref:Peptidyl-prolyl cis-trans isomerase CYP38-like PsbQ-like domain-containing protein n=1 Tax=Papaver somniferum TaxID=3469 RepID=A0A4Y7J454_PAPSO|nr:hypothetical protein C5167_014075 [Papaver somniferum]